MNYFELWVGDYLRDTKHLSLAEHGAYLLLLSTIYSTERGLPADMPSLYRICSAMLPAEQKAVRTVAERFFPVGADGLRHNARAQREMAKAAARVEAARKNGMRGGRPPKGGADPGQIGTQEKPSGFPVGSENETQTQTQPKAPQPHKSQEQDQEQFLASQQELARREPPPRSAGVPEPVDRPMPAATPRPAIPTAAGLACRLMRDAGCAVTNPGHPDLLAALAEGCTPEELAATAAEAIAGGIRKPFPWAIATTRGRRADGPSTPHAGAPRHDHADHRSGSRRPSLVERAAAAERRTLERLAAAERGEHGQAVAPDDRDLRPSLDGRARRVRGG